MAPRLPLSTLYLIRDKIKSQSFTTSRMAEEAECGKLTITNIRRHLRQFGSCQFLTPVTLHFAPGTL